MRAGAALWLTSGAILIAALAQAEDWPRFRGPNGAAKAVNAIISLRWSEQENLRWKTPLPGPGASSPIVYDDRVYVTCYSGYGIDRENPGEVAKLVRHLLAVDRASGRIEWTADFPATQPEDTCKGFLAEHGYASNTPATDGSYIYAFLGKSGVVAVDLAGNTVWQTSVGTGSVEPHWGSAASVVLHDDKVIVNASDESHSIWALDKTTGRERWRYEDERLKLAVGTPALVSAAAVPQVVIACPDHLLAISAETGKLVWSAEIPIDDNIAPSVTVGDDVVYATGGLEGGSVAVRLGGQGDVTNSHVLWTSRHYSYIGTPVFHERHLYWISDRGLAYCLRATDGELTHRERLKIKEGAGRAFYASPLLVGDKLLAVSRYHGAFLFEAGPRMALVANNIFQSDDSSFGATPAVAGSEIFLRSDNFLYCIGLPQ
ncbi:MAG: PQQ-binding-like beta-propeller repeat protein [Pirellulales bacterium]